MKKKKKKVLNILFNILVWVVILIAASVTIISISTSDRGVANILGTVPFSIQTKSMEPDIKVGDLILTSKYENQELKKGDIISFFAKEEDQLIVKTHTIVEIIDRSGMISYKTKGINNLEVDDVEVVNGDIVSIYNGDRVPFLGKVLDFLKSQWGFFIFIVLPLFVFFVYQLYTFIILVIESKKDQIIAAAKK